MVLSFTMNQKNCARYATYYLTQVESFDSTHPGAHEKIQGISVCSNDTGIREPIDGTREQTFVSNSKTVGNYFSFLMCSGETFSEEVNIFLFAIIGPYKITLSRTT